KQGVPDEQLAKMREWMRNNEEYEDAPTLDPKSVAKRSGSASSYMFYQHFVWDSHPSVETLSRYYVPPDSDGRPGIDLHPKTDPQEVIETLSALCVPVVGVYLSVSGLLTGDIEVPAITALVEEYKRLEATR